MNDVQAINSVKSYHPAQASDVKREYYSLSELPPDSVEISNKQKPTAAGLLVAGAAAGTASVGAYKGAKAFIGKSLKFVEEELNGYREQAGKAVKNFSGSFKSLATGIGAVGAAIGAFALVFKDSDKDGNLDILEAVNKFTTGK